MILEWFCHPVATFDVFIILYVALNIAGFSRLLHHCPCWRRCSCTHYHLHLTLLDWRLFPGCPWGLEWCGRAQPPLLRVLLFLGSYFECLGAPIAMSLQPLSVCGEWHEGARSLSLVRPLLPLLHHRVSADSGIGSHVISCHLPDGSWLFLMILVLMIPPVSSWSPPSHSTISGHWSVTINHTDQRISGQTPETLMHSGPFGLEFKLLRKCLTLLWRSWWILNLWDSHLTIWKASLPSWRSPGWALGWAPARQRGSLPVVVCMVHRLTGSVQSCRNQSRTRNSEFESACQTNARTHTCNLTI